LEVMDFMRARLVEYQKETGNIYNLEATPAESTSYRLAQKDRKLYPEIITSGTKKIPYYTNSTQLPVNYTDDIFEELKLQDDLQCKYTGGTVEHIFIGEEISDIETVKSLIKKAFENNRLPYITITPTFSICPSHGYIAGKHFTCPKCIIEQPCEVYSRVVGYLRPVQQWNEGKQQEFKDRKEFKIKSSVSSKKK
nr:ribonucleoside triphosphate reductase [Candidatus Parcubacteria bacterium]